ncbi:MFS transporter [Sulfobacillus harzensis]|uniref:MFS transporter n=1 Tax=Sulfobacillus harzensis TaxID=2729629 RepID=A0A7Y0L7C6_9FIRM|nr:MFS transporter [Sulfobacillus harzensis]
MSGWISRRFLVYAVGNSLNNIGNAMYTVALPLWVYHLTHSSFSMGLVVAIEASSLIFQPIIGAWVDRGSPRHLLIVSLGFQAVISALLPLLAWRQLLTLSDIYGAAFLLALGGDALQSVQTVVVPRMFGAQKDRASAGLTAAYTVTTMAGPLLGAAVLAWAGFQTLLWINVLSFLAPVALLPWTRVPRGRERSLHTARPGWWSETTAGFRVIRDHQPIRMLLTCLLAFRFVNAALLPLAEFLLKGGYHLSNARVSGLFVIEGLGSFIGTQLPLRLRRISTVQFLLMMAACNVLGLLCLFIPAWPAVPAGLFLGSAGYLGAVVARNIVLQNQVPMAVLGNASASFRTATGMAAILSPLLMGFVTSTRGPGLAIGALALISALPLVLLRPKASNSWDHQGTA